jgi:hypothetical protein
MREKGERKGEEGEGRSEEGEEKSVRCVHHNQTNWSALMLGTRRIMPTNCVSHRKLTCLLLLLRQAGGVIGRGSSYWCTPISGWINWRQGAMVRGEV